jgi:hypothetical protein
MRVDIDQRKTLDARGLKNPLRIIRSVSGPGTACFYLPRYTNAVAKTTPVGNDFILECAFLDYQVTFAGAH